MPTFPDFNIAIDEDTLDGLYRRFDDEEKVLLPKFVKDTGLTRRLRFMQKSRALDRPWDDVSVTGATLEWAIGKLDESPESGTFSLDYNGDPTSIINLSGIITDTALEAALNLNPSIDADGGVTVDQSGTEYTIRANTVTFSDFLSVTDFSTLSPASTAELIVVEPGDGVSVKYVAILRIAQQPWAYTNSFAAISAGTVTQSVVRAGTDSLPEIQRIAISDGVYGGAFNATLQKQEKTLIGTVASGGNAAIYDVTTVADSGQLGGKFFDLYDDAGAVRVWIDVNNASTAPPTPTGGRLVEVDVATSATASAVATAVQTKLEADAKFSAYIYDTAKVRVLDISAGARGTADAQNSGFTVTTIVAGSAGPLGGKYFLLQDKDGPVAVWFSMSGDVAPQTGDYNRAISVTITGTSTAAQVATAIQTAVDADAQFVATASGNTVTITDAAGGTRTAATQGNATVLSVYRKTAGVSVSAQIPWNADPTTVAELLGRNVGVTKYGNTWDLTFTENGDQADITVASAGLLFPQSVTMTLLLNKLALHQAFAATDADELTATMEIKITFSGEQPLVVFHADCTVVRNLIDLGTLGTLVLGTSPRILTATKTWDPDNTADGDWSTPTTITVAGARQGDPAIAGLTSNATLGWLPLLAVVTANDTVTVAAFNLSGSALNIGSGTLRVDVIHH